MDKVRDGEYWLPQVDNVNFKPITSPPQKAIVWAELQRLLTDQELVLGLKRPVSLDVKWLLQLVGTLDPLHPWFKKGYRPSKNTIIKPIKMVANFDGFFTGLEPERTVGNKRRTANIRVQKEHLPPDVIERRESKAIRKKNA